MSCPSESRPPSALNPAGMSRPLLLTQVRLLDLSAGGPRQCVDELDGLRHLVPRDSHLHVLHQLYFAGLGPRPQHDERLRTLAPFLVWYADHGDFEYRRVRLDRLLDLDGRDVLAPGDDDVLGAIAQFDVPVWMHHTEVAGVQRPAPEYLGGGLFVAEVTGHDVVASHHDLAHGDAVARHVDHVLVDNSHRVGLDHGHALPGLQPGLIFGRQGVPGRLPFIDRVRPVDLGHPVDMNDPGAEVPHPGDHGRAGWRAGHGGE